MPDTLSCFYLLSAPRSNTAPLSETQGYARRWRVGYLGGGSWWGREDVPDYARTRDYGRRYWSRRNRRQDLPGNVPYQTRGGHTMTARQPFDPWKVLAEHRACESLANSRSTLADHKSVQSPVVSKAYENSSSSRTSSGGGRENTASYRTPY